MDQCFHNTFYWARKTTCTGEIFTAPTEGYTEKHPGDRLETDVWIYGTQLHVTSHAWHQKIVFLWNIYPWSTSLETPKFRYLTGTDTELSCCSGKIKHSHIQIVIVLKPSISQRHVPQIIHVLRVKLTPTGHSKEPECLLQASNIKHFPLSAVILQQFFHL